MHTTPLSAVLPAAQKDFPRKGGDGGTDADVPDLRFSTMMTRRHGAEPGSMAGGATRHATGTKARPAAEDEPILESDGALAQAAAEQGLSLPQMALSIAAEVAAVRRSAGRGAGLPEGGAQTEARDDSRDAGAPPSTRFGAIDATRAASASPRDAVLAAPAGRTTPLAAVLSAASAPHGAAGAQPAAIGASGAAARASAVPHPALPPSAPVNVGKAASLAGARQAVLTRQARMQAGEGEPAKTGAYPEVFTALADSASARGLPDARPAAPARTETGGLHAAAAAGAYAAGPLPPHAVPHPVPGAAAAHSGVTVPLHSPEWAPELGRRFVSMTQGGHNMPHTAELRLDPPELGPLRITINLHDNVVQAAFVSPHAAVRQSVENALPQLQQQLAQAGISLGQTSVNDQGQSGQAFNEAAGQGAGSRPSGSAASSVSAGAAAAPSPRNPAPDALVDTFA